MYVCKYVSIYLNTISFLNFYLSFRKKLYTWHTIIFQMAFRFSGTPLVIVYQNPEQRKRMNTYGGGVVFMDATYKGLLKLA